MKKRYVVLAALGIAFGYIAKTDHWFEDEREIYFPITKEQLRASVKAEWAEKNNQKSEQLNIVDVIASKQLARHDLQGQIFRAIDKRLAKPYGIDSHRNEREVIQRLNLLQAMSHYWPNDKVLLQVAPGQLKDLLLRLAKDNNEDMQVRRQAYKYWMNFCAASGMISTEKAKLANLATHSDSRLIATLAQSAE